MQENKRIAVNSIVIFLRLCITSVVGLLASRLILDALGASDYGLYNVVGGLVTLLNILNTTMISTTYRFIAYELGKGDSGDSHRVFNASFIIHALLAFLILIIGISVGEWYVNNYLNVAADKIEDAIFVLRVSVITAAISTMMVPHQGLLIANEKFTITALVDIVLALLRLGVIYFFLYLPDNRLRFYSMIMLGYTTLQALLFYGYNFIYYRRIVSFAFIKDSALYKKMLSFSLWTLFGGFANVGKSQGMVMIINFFYGTIVNAAFAVANNISRFVTVFANSLSQAAIPQITKSFGGGNEGRSITLTSYISKYSFLLMSIVAFPVLLETDFLLSVWLKEVPVGASTFCRIVVLDALLGCLGAGIPALVNATGDIKWYQIVLYTFIFMGVPLAYFLAKIGFNQFMIPVVYCFITVGGAAIKLLFLKYYYKIEIRMIYDISYKCIFKITIPLLVVFLFYNPGSFTIFGHIMGMVLSEVLLIVVIYFLGMNSRERNMINEMLQSGIKRIRR